MQCRYPQYDVELTPAILSRCRDIGQRLLAEVGLQVNHEQFVEAIRKHDGVCVEGGRVRLSRKLTDRHYDVYIESNRRRLLAQRPPDGASEWSISHDGFSIAVMDMETDEVRPATCQDLRDLIRLARSFNMSGNYPCAPQDVPPLMRALACFKICWEESDTTRPFDYLDFRQTPYLFEMHQVMGKPFVVNVNVPRPMAVSEHDIETFLHYYPIWKRDRRAISWYSICDYPMLGVNRPITSSGSLAAYLSQSFGVHVLFQLFDPEINMAPRLLAGMPVDLRTMCWAYGSPRMHLYHFLNSAALPALCGLEPDQYTPSDAFMCTSSCAVDVRAGMEKMASALVSAMQGARRFTGAGNLAVDDLFSGLQLIVDVEIFEHVREMMDSFHPGPDLLATDGLYELIRDVALGYEEFYSHPDTASKIRALLPASMRRPSEKLRAWMAHGQNMTHLVREEALRRIRNQPPFELASDKRKELDAIYSRAEKELA